MGKPKTILQQNRLSQNKSLPRKQSKSRFKQNHRQSSSMASDEAKLNDLKKSTLKAAKAAETQTPQMSDLIFGDETLPLGQQAKEQIDQLILVQTDSKGLVTF